MNPQQLSSGDLIADRRSAYAQGLAETGDPQAAADLMTQALDIAPDWAAGWFRLADYEEKSGRKEAAIAALRTVLKLNPGDVFGASLKLTLLGDTQPAHRPSSLYVARLFDDYAERFDTALVEKLDYSVPEKLSALVRDQAGERRFGRVVDLGCGTGLFGKRIRPHADQLEGFDLSVNMLNKAQEKAIYDRLASADLSLSPEASGIFGDDARPHRADLVSAADVLMYLGALDGVFKIAARLLSMAGLFAFSVEDGSDVDGFTLRPSLRYAHSGGYVRSLCAANGFEVLRDISTTIRKDGGKPVAGILFVARRTG